MTHFKFKSILYRFIILLLSFCLPACSHLTSMFDEKQTVFYNESSAIYLNDHSDESHSCEMVSSNYSSNSNSSLSKDCSSSQSIFSSSSFNTQRFSNFNNICIEKWWESSPSLQDGCIYDNTMFLFKSSGVCQMFDINDKSLICSIQLPDYNGFLPHSNSVCFGNKLFESDPFPLLYTNVYNNYSSEKTSYGLCLVYRIIFDETFDFEIVQAIKVTFTDDLAVWYNNSENESPFGNFLVDGEDLWVYVNIFGSSITRFFKFEKPKVIIGDGVDCCKLSLLDIKSSFDLSLFRYIQGGVIVDGFLFSLEGFGDKTNPAILRSVNLVTNEMHSFNLSDSVGNYEPEFIDCYDDSLIIGMSQGNFFCLK